MCIRDRPYRWRGRYNEDTDLSLRVLKDGWCTLQFNAFLQGKEPTTNDSKQQKGGNTEQFYSKEGTYNKSKMLYDMHPDVVRMVWKFGRCHHYVDYNVFKHNLIRKKGLKIKKRYYNTDCESIDCVVEDVGKTKATHAFVLDNNVSPLGSDRGIVLRAL